MTNVATFAGGFTFGTLFAVPTSFNNYDYITNLLSGAFILFAASLFIGIGVHWLLRRFESSDDLSKARLIVCYIHTFSIVVLLIAGFVVLDAVLIAIGHRIAGIFGLGLLILIPFWFIGIYLFEKWLGDDVIHPPDLVEVLEEFTKKMGQGKVLEISDTGKDDVKLTEKQV